MTDYINNNETKQYNKSLPNDHINNETDPCRIITLIIKQPPPPPAIDHINNNVTSFVTDHINNIETNPI